MSKTIKIEVIEGVEGQSLYVHDYRVCGPKPWGGGKVIHSFDIPPNRLCMVRDIVNKNLKENEMDGTVKRNIKKVDIVKFTYHVEKIMGNDKDFNVPMMCSDLRELAVKAFGTIPPDAEFVAGTVNDD